ncbi:hypothetical protein DFQ30_008198, partial [Apophysomyces sp. BC1015]
MIGGIGGSSTATGACRAVFSSRLSRAFSSRSRNTEQANDEEREPDQDQRCIPCIVGKEIERRALR